jgi:hypothetical protein
MPIVPVLVIVPPVIGAVVATLVTVPEVTFVNMLSFNVSNVIEFVSKAPTPPVGATLSTNWSGGRYA